MENHKTNHSATNNFSHIQHFRVSLKFSLNSFFKQGESSLAPSETFSQKVNRFDIEFTGKLIGLMNKINEIASENPSDKFINLIHR